MGTINSNFATDFSIELTYDDQRGCRQRLCLDNPFGGTLLVGHPGWGKSSVLMNILHQHIAQGFGLCLFEDQYGQLTQEVERALAIHQQVYIDRYGKAPELIRINLDQLSHCEPIDLLLESDTSTINATLFTARRLLRIADEASSFRRNPESEEDYQNRCYLLTGIIWYLKQQQRKRASLEPEIPTPTLAHILLFLTRSSREVMRCLETLPELQNFYNQFPVDEIDEVMWMLQGKLTNTLSSLLSSEFIWFSSGPQKDLAINRLECPRIICVGYCAGSNTPQRMMATLLMDMIYKQSNPDISGQNTPRIPSAFILDQRVGFQLNPQYVTHSTNSEYQLAVYTSCLNLFSLEGCLGQNRLTTLLDAIGQLIIGSDNPIHTTELLKQIPLINLLSLESPIGQWHDPFQNLPPKTSKKKSFWFKNGLNRVITGYFDYTLPFLEDKLDEPTVQQNITLLFKQKWHQLKALFVKRSPIARTAPCKPVIESAQQQAFHQLIDIRHRIVSEEIDHFV